jgi:AAA domain
VRDGIDPDAFEQRDARLNGQDGPAAAIWVDGDAWEESSLPRRPWIAPGFALRKAVTVIAGPPSAMKSSLMLAWGCTLALGRKHGRFAPTAAGCVVIYNVEDDATEQRRRLSAALRQFEATPAEIAGKVIRAGPTGVGMLFVRDTETGEVFATAAMARLRLLLEERKPDLLIADPLAEVHGADENDNTALRQIVAEFRALAVEFNIAIILVHHTRKGGVVPGDPDSARGASAIIGAGRVVFTLVSMSEADAEVFGMPKDRKNRARYVRLDSAKQNYASLDDAIWFEAALYTLDNGEVVSAAVPWQPPDFWSAITTVIANRILDDIDAGLDNGTRRYSAGPAAKDRAAWPVVIRYVASLTEAQARSVIKTWLRNGVLFTDQYDDPVDRKKRSGLSVNNAKRAGANAP